MTPIDAMRMILLLIVVAIAVSYSLWGGELVVIKKYKAIPVEIEAITVTDKNMFWFSNRKGGDCNINYDDYMVLAPYMEGTYVDKKNNYYEHYSKEDFESKYEGV